MFEPLSEFMRLKRKQRGLTQEKLAKMAKVSRRQLALMEDGHNVSILFLTKIADALEISEIPVGRLRLFTPPPELAPLVRAADAVMTLKQAGEIWREAAATIENSAASLDAMIDTAIPDPLPPGLMERMEAAIDRFAKIPPERSEAAGKALRRIAGRYSFRRMRPKPAPGAGGGSDDDSLV